MGTDISIATEGKSFAQCEKQLHGFGAAHDVSYTTILYTADMRRS